MGVAKANQLSFPSAIGFGSRQRRHHLSKGGMSGSEMDRFSDDWRPRPGPDAIAHGQTLVALWGGDQVVRRFSTFNTVQPARARWITRRPAAGR
jgi:hypothetical protein